MLENFGRSIVPLLSAERTREAAAVVDLCMLNTILSNVVVQRRDDDFECIWQSAMMVGAPNRFF